MNENSELESISYKVVTNHEEQHSIWPAEKAIPLGWKDAGKSGLKSECLEYINKVWTDMRPLSLRKKMKEIGKAKTEDTIQVSENTNKKDSLLTRLSSGEHSIEIDRIEKTDGKDIQKRIKQGYIHIKFPATKGGTVLGITLEEKACKLDNADFERNLGSVYLEGNLILDYVKARCIAEIDLKTKKGLGHLEPV